MKLCKICNAIVVPDSDTDILQIGVGPRCRRCLVNLINEVMNTK
jgi:hypothetical protein